MEKEAPLSRSLHQSFYGDRLRDPKWREYSEALKDRRGRLCQICGLTEAEDGASLEVHHRGYREGKEPWEYGGNEVIVLCHDCHGNIHFFADRAWNRMLRCTNQHVLHECDKAIEEVLARHPTWNNGPDVEKDEP